VLAHEVSLYFIKGAERLCYGLEYFPASVVVSLTCAPVSLRSNAGFGNLLNRL